MVGPLFSRRWRQGDAELRYESRNALRTPQTSGSLVDVPATVAHYLDLVEYILVRLSLFASVVLVLCRVIVKEWRKR